MDFGGRGVNNGLPEALNVMRPTTAPTNDYAHDLVMEILRTGLMLTDLLADLIEAMPNDAYPGENNGEVVLEMLIGTVRPVADAAGERAVRSAIRLLHDSGEKTLTDLRLSLELKRLRDPGAATERQAG
jgi:hypothetical protein